MRFLLTSWVAMNMSSRGVNNNSGSMVIVGLNGALQKRLVLPQDSSLVPGNVHRAESVQVGVGGKGQDVAIALSCLNIDTKNIRLAHFVGSGPEGDYVYELLRELLGGGDDASSDDDWSSMTVRSASQMRTCTTIVASDSSTEMVEPSGVITEKEVQELLNKLEGGGNSAKALCIMGSMPPGCSTEMYAQIYKRIISNNNNDSKTALCLIDSVVGLEPLLQAMAKSPCGGAILKVNASELCRLAGVKRQGSSEAQGVTSDELVQAVDQFLEQYSPHALQALHGLAITDGKHPAHLVAFEKEAQEEEGITTNYEIFKIPVVDLSGNDGTKVARRVLYPIGAGDTVAAGTLAAWRFYEKNQPLFLSGEKIERTLQSHLGGDSSSIIMNCPSLPDQDVRHMVSAFAFGLACGSASCLQEQNSIFDVEDALRLFRQAAPPSFVATS